MPAGWWPCPFFRRYPLCVGGMGLLLHNELPFRMSVRAIGDHMLTLFRAISIYAAEGSGALGGPISTREHVLLVWLALRQHSPLRPGGAGAGFRD